MAKQITVPASIESIDTVTAFVEEELELRECSMKIAIKISVAIDEIFGNIARYAYGDETGEATVSMEFQDDPRGVILTFVDSGIPYNPLEKADPDVTLSVDEREVGGLGIFIVKKSMDDITYKNENGKNILSILKCF